MKLLRKVIFSKETRVEFAYKDVYTAIKTQGMNLVVKFSEEKVTPALRRSLTFLYGHCLFYANKHAIDERETWLIVNRVFSWLFDNDSEILLEELKEMLSSGDHFELMMVDEGKNAAKLYYYKQIHTLEAYLEGKITL